MADIPFVEGILTALSALGNRLLLAALVLLVGIIIARLIRNATRKGLSELGLNAVLSRFIGFNAEIEELLSIAVLWAAYAITGLIALNLLGIESLALSALAAIIIALLLISLLLSLAQAMPNIASGLHIRRKRMVRPGDILTLRTITGTVKHAGLFDVAVQTKEKEMVYIPNRSLLRETHFSVKRP